MNKKNQEFETPDSFMVFRLLWLDLENLPFPH